jgi:hypothetical protein
MRHILMIHKEIVSLERHSGDSILKQTSRGARFGYPIYQDISFPFLANLKTNDSGYTSQSLVGHYAKCCYAVAAERLRVMPLDRANAAPTLILKVQTNPASFH